MDFLINGSNLKHQEVLFRQDALALILSVLVCYFTTDSISISGFLTLLCSMITALFSWCHRLNKNSPMQRIKWWLLWWLIVCPSFYDMAFLNHVSAMEHHPAAVDDENQSSKIEESEKYSNSKDGQNIDLQVESNQLKGDDIERDSKNGHADDISNRTNIVTEGKNMSKNPMCKDYCLIKNNPNVESAKCCMEYVYNVLNKGDPEDTVQFIKAIETLEEVLKETEMEEEETTTMSHSNLVAILHKPKGIFNGLEINACEDKLQVSKGRGVHNCTVNIQLPKELDPGVNDKIVFCMVNMSGAMLGVSDEELYENRLVSLSVHGKTISGLQQRVNITMAITTAINKNQEPTCKFYNFSARVFNQSGCTTISTVQGYITCSCDHLTYFGVLLTSPDLPDEHLEILQYISLIGCSLSLLALLITVVLFITKRKVLSDSSMKVHLNLTVALILLNLHFLPSQKVASLPSTGACLYMALLLHYSLLASFSWMALEGFHLYILLVKVFNIYVRRYMLKLSLVGWGVPAVVVVLVVIVDNDAYGRVPLDSSNANTTTICYILNDTVKIVTTIGVFSLVFLFNLIMFGVTLKRVVSLRHNKKGQSDCNQTKQDMCSLLGVITLLGITWGLIFFSFGNLTTPGLYVFCIINSLQGFFIFLWFVMSLRKTGGSVTKTSNSEPTPTL